MLKHEPCLPPRRQSPCSIESFPSLASAALAGFRSFREKHWQPGNPFQRTARIGTFGFEHECVSATQVSEQYFEDAVSRILFAFGVDGDRAAEEEHATHEFSRGLCAQAVWIEQSQFSRVSLYLRAQLAKHDHGMCGRNVGVAVSSLRKN